MKKLKYFSVFALLFGLLTFACDEGVIRPGDGDDHEDDPIILDPPPPPPSSDNTVTMDSIS